MTSPNNFPKWWILGSVFPIVFINAWLLIQLGKFLQPITSIIITACLIAFLLEYPIRLLINKKIPKGWAIALVLLISLAFTTITIIFLGPLVWQQLNDFVVRLPRWIEQVKTKLLLLEEQPIFQNSPVDFDQITVEAINQISIALQSGTSQVINITLSTIDSILNLLVTTVLSIMLVINGEKLWNGLLSWFSSEWQIRIRNYLKSSFRGYFSGQAILALILAAALSTAFILLDIPFGLLFGIVIGTLSIIPFGGTVAVIGVSTLLAFQKISLGLKVLTVALVLGQINDNVIAPRLIGGVTGLNPVVVIVALLIGAKFAGFLGLILAVPTASFFKKSVDVLRTPIDVYDKNA